MLNEIVKIVEHKNIFLRNKKCVETKILGVLLYHRGLSYRDSSKILSVIEGCSHEAVRYWYIQFKNLFVMTCKERRAIAIDETKIKREKKQVYLWAAVDVDKKRLYQYMSLTRDAGLIPIRS